MEETTTSLMSGALWNTGAEVPGGTTAAVGRTGRALVEAGRTASQEAPWKE